MSPRAFLYVVFCLSLLGNVYAQTNLGSKDSLLRTLKTLPRDTNRVNTLLRLDKIAATEQAYDSAVYYGKLALDLATELKFERGIATAQIDLGVSYWYMGNYTESLNMNYAALGIFQRT